MTRASLPPPPALASDNSILLDFDGTLVDLVDRPNAVMVDGALVRLIGRLVESFERRVAIVSGRSVAQLERFLGGLAGDVGLVGSHGAEVRATGPCLSNARPPELDYIERAIRLEMGATPGVLIEAKALGVAVYFRLVPAAEQRVRAVVESLAAGSGLTMQEGKMMLELRTSGADKGSGIAALMQQPPFAGTVPVFAGDDVTDEAGFVAVARLGGYGVLVGVERPTAARFLLPGVSAVRAWLGHTL